MMDKNKKSRKNEVEDTLACTAFAEAGEPCPIGGKEQAEATPETTHALKEKKKSVLGIVEDDFACTAFHDQNEKCPIGGEKK